MKKEKNSILAALLSFLIAGLGQLYLGQIKNAIIFFILEISTAFLAIFVNEALGSLLNLLISIWSAYYAYLDAKKTKPIKTEKNKNEREIYVH